ncbi:glycosyltransferase family 4 protein [Sphingomonas humi]|uniref:Glycosyltransferase n=1 Tax=Sphingomonas humi TaxID=335630 RepID=A0ABP7RZ67_9SPHN
MSGSVAVKILYVLNDDPSFSGYGGALRNRQILRSLRKVGKVDVVWIRSAGDQRLLSEPDGECISCLQLPPPRSLKTRLENYRFGRSEIGKLYRANRYDVIVTRQPAATLVVPKNLFPKVIMDCDDFVKSFAGGTFRQKVRNSLRTYATKRLIGKVRHVWLCSEPDLARARPLNPGTSLLRNIVAPFTPRTHASRSGLRVMMVGAFNYSPNLEGLRWFAGQVFGPVADKLGHVELHAVGLATEESKALGSDRIRIRGFVEDLHAEYALADVVICPVQSGGGTQIKVIEGLISERPVLCSRFSYLPFATLIEDGQHLIVADGAEEWKDKLEQILLRPDDFISMSREGRRRALEVFGEESFDREVANTVGDVLSDATKA